MQAQFSGSGGEKLEAPPETAPAAGDAQMIEVPVSPGELIDKISILEIKAERIKDPEKLKSVVRALELLQATRRRALPASSDLSRMEAELKRVNEALWDIEDSIRAREAAKDFGLRFVELARLVYQTNDRRAATKKQIDRLFGSDIGDEKSYEGY